MSKTFVKDPRDVVKPGDVVRVKVLDVDVPRKRISLTLRLDDEATPPSQSTGARDRSADRGGDRGGDRRGQRGSGGRSGRGAPTSGGALADALRRAGLAE
jgi:uncharacterized protein